MPKARKPRKGSMQYWPRKRAKRAYARVRTFSLAKEAKPLGFCGYKVGMTHVIITDNKATSMTKGENIFCPVTIIECPPIKTASILFYKKTTSGLQLASALMAPKLDKELKRKIILPKKIEKKVEDFKPEEFDDIAVLVYTQPKLTTIGKKKPELFRLALGGSIQEKFEWAKANLGKEIQISDILNEGQQIDIHAITKGKGFQGPVKRFGVAIRQHKSEKTKRGPGNLGAWHPHHGNFTVAHAGQMGYHQRTEYNKWLIRIGTKPEEINLVSGFKRYGIVKNQYALIKGSISGPAKRLIVITNPLRPRKNIPKEAPTIQYISK
ncbi:50S ribosomal protein L3 [Candidatus Woesearchaeota archaeon]|nr:50S ribosomal protein L3 [Candidatus Woesearchaeota archaeon]